MLYSTIITAMNYAKKLNFIWILCLLKQYGMQQNLQLHLTLSMMRDDIIYIHFRYAYIYIYVYIWCKSLFCELRKISQMSTFLNEASLQKLVISFALSRMDYCNSLLVNLPNDTITNLRLREIMSLLCSENFIVFRFKLGLTTKSGSCALNA